MPFDIADYPSCTAHERICRQVKPDKISDTFFYLTRDSYLFALITLTVELTLVTWIMPS